MSDSRRNSKMLRGFVALLILLGVVGFVVPTASLATTMAPMSNHINKPFWFDLSVNGQGKTAATEKRGKENDTTVFFWAQKFNYGLDYCNLYVWADTNVYGRPAANPTKNGYAITRGAQPGSIRTDAYEDGYRRVWVEAYQSSKPGQLQGEWSPDSTRTYTILNVGY